MTSYRISVIDNGRRINVETSLEEFDFYSLRVGPSFLKIRELAGKLSLDVPLQLPNGILPNEAVTRAQLDDTTNQGLLNLAAIESLQIGVEEARLLAALQAGEVARLDRELEYLKGNRAVEERITSGLGGQTVFTATQIKWQFDNAVPDIAVYLEDKKQRQDLAGATVDAFRKLSDVQLEFSEIIPQGLKVTIRLEGDRFVNARTVEPFFREYVTGVEGLNVPVSDFEVGTGRLAPYRNGVALINSPYVGDLVGKYVESGTSAIELGLAVAAADITTFYHLPSVPTYRVAVSGISGVAITVPAYTLGSNRLRVYRNGLIMNAAAIGDLDAQYTELSATVVQLATAADPSEAFLFEYLDVVPVWRDDLTGITGVDVDFTFGNNYTQGDKKLQVWKNGVLLFDSLTLGTPADRYQENGANCILLEEAAEATDVFTAIYLS